MNPKIIMALAIIIGIVLVIGYYGLVLSSGLPSWVKWLLLRN